MPDQQSDIEEFYGDGLRHYGKLGMKWGRRMNKVSSVQSRAKAKDDASEDARDAHAALSKAKTKGTAALSNRELQAAITRQNLEKQYAQLNPDAKAQAKKVTNKLLAQLGNQAFSTVSSMAIKAGAKALKASLEK